MRRLAPDIETLARRLADGRLPRRRGSRDVAVPQPAPAAAAAARGRSRRRQDRGRQGARARPRHTADPPAVLRGHRRGRGAVRVELPAPAAQHPPRRSERLDARRRGAVRPRLPDPPAAAARARASRPAARSAADRRDRPRRRRLRGVPARAARGCERDDSGDRDDPGHASADHRPDLEPDARPARRGQAPLPLPPDLVPDAAARGRDRAPPRQGRLGDAGGAGGERRLAHARQRCAEAARASPSRSTGWRA